MKLPQFRVSKSVSDFRVSPTGCSPEDIDETVLPRKYGISEGTYYNWKAKFGGMEVSDAKRLRALEDENAKLKRLFPSEPRPENQHCNCKSAQEEPKRRGLPERLIIT